MTYKYGRNKQAAITKVNTLEARKGTLSRLLGLSCLSDSRRTWLANEIDKAQFRINIYRNYLSRI